MHVVEKADFRHNVGVLGMTDNTRFVLLVRGFPTRRRFRVDGFRLVRISVCVFSSSLLGRLLVGDIEDANVSV